MKALFMFQCVEGTTRAVPREEDHGIKKHFIMLLKQIPLLPPNSLSLPPFYRVLLSCRGNCLKKNLTFLILRARLRETIRRLLYQQPISMSCIIFAIKF